MGYAPDEMESNLSFVTKLVSFIQAKIKILLFVNTE
jgi:hypothetical protein